MSKVYLIEGGSGEWDDAYPFVYGIFTNKEEADNYCLEINKLIAEAKSPFSHINCCTDDKFNDLSYEQQSQYFEVSPLWEANVVEKETNVLFEVGIIKS